MQAERTTDRRGPPVAPEDQGHEQGQTRGEKQQAMDVMVDPSGQEAVERTRYRFSESIRIKLRMK